MSEGRRTTVRTAELGVLAALAGLAATLLVPQVAAGQVVAYDMVGSADLNLVSYSNPYAGAFSSAADGFQKYQRGVSATIPFAVLDDSLSIFPTDNQGIIKEGNADVFFAAADTENPENSGPVSATWTFDVSGATGLVLSVDMGAMGNFESDDFFEWSYSIDGGPELTAFSSSVDEAGSHTYTLEGGASVTLDDPMTMLGQVLTNDLATFGAAIVGTGATLELTLTAQTNGSGEAFAFQNLILSEGGLPTGILAYDMLASAAQNLTSYSNPYAGAFSSAADGFQKYQRGVSATIPFAVLDDSLSIFPTDNQGIIKEGNADVFFAAADTENPENSGPVSATWTFDVSGATTGLILSVDMGAMGNFESNDFFEWSYSIDGGPELTAFSSSVDEAGSHTYTLEGGASVTLDDPMTMLGQVLTNDLRAFSAPLAGLGSELTVTLTAQTNGSGEAFAFQNLILSDGDTPPPPPTEVEIYTIQGSGSASLFDGWTVTTRNNAVTALAPNGFFMQTPTDRSDGDDDTSDGIFVFTGGAPGVSVGQRVDVTGEVDEFFGFTEIAGSPTVEVSGTGDLPAAVVFDATRPTPSPLFDNCAIEFECWEGMLVSVPAGTVTGPHLRFGSDPFAEVLIVTRLTRAYREEGIEYPGLPTYPVWDGNPEIFEMDPDKLISPTAPIPAGSTFSATGVLGFEFGDYELWPTTLTVSRASVPVPVRERNAGEFTVGTLNVFRLFDDFDDDPDFAADGRERDDAVVSTTVYQRRLQKLSDYIRNVLRAPDILAIQEVEKLDVLVDLADRIAADDTSMVYSAHLVEGNDVGTIDIGFLTRRQIQVDSITQVGKTETFINPEDGEPDILHDRPPLLLEGSCQLEYGSFPIAVMTVHNRSLSSINTERVRQKRFEQAESIAQKVQDLQIADADVRLVVIGDFNAFQFTDGYVDAVGIIRGEFDPVENLICETNICTDLVAPNLTNEVTSLDPADRYSFVFEGSAQVLDHALTTTGLATEMTGAAYGRGNADAALEWLNDDSTPLRSSDHDGMVVYILKDEDNDGVPNDDDACPGTTIPESVPIERLGVNRFALVTEDGIFDTALSRGMGPRKRFTVGDTAGCSCEQIIAAAGLGYGHSKFGCSISAMEDWILLVQAVATAR